MIQKKKGPVYFERIVTQANTYLNDEKNKQKTIAYIYIILSLLTISFFGIFAIAPTLTTITELKKEYDDSKQVFQQLKAKNQALSSLREQFRTIEADYPLLLAAIPDSPNASKITRQIEIVASQNNLSISTIEIGKIKVFPSLSPDSSVSTLEFTVSAQGNHENIESFLKQIVSIDRVTSIERLTTGEDRDGFGVILTGNAFFYK